MPRKPSDHPTDAELAILQVLWQNGPSTVREVHGRLHSDDEVGYTTVLKTLQIMTEKGLVQRDASERAHRYAPTSSEDQVQKNMLSDLMERAFRGSASRLVQQALTDRKASKQELEEIRRLLDELSGDES